MVRLTLKILVKSICKAKRKKTDNTKSKYFRYKIMMKYSINKVKRIIMLKIKAWANVKKILRSYFCRTLLNIIYQPIIIMAINKANSGNIRKVPMQISLYNFLLYLFKNWNDTIKTKNIRLTSIKDSPNHRKNLKNLSNSLLLKNK